MGKQILGDVLAFVGYVLLQGLFLRHVSLFEYGFCFLYLSVLLLLPFDMGLLRMMFLGFALGFVVDIMYDTMGIHAAACVLAAYVRPWIIKALSPGGGYESDNDPTIESMGFQWFASYCLLMLTIHHFVLLLLEASTLSRLPRVIGLTVGSVLLTFGVMVLFQYLFYMRSRVRRK